MPQRDHSSLWPADSQSTADQDWQQLVEQRLPAELEAQARVLKALRAGRAACHQRCACCTGCSIMCSATPACASLRAWSRLIGLTSTVISGQAWHKRSASECRLALVALQCEAFRSHTELGRAVAAHSVGRYHSCLLPRQASRHLALALCLRPVGGAVGLGAYQHEARG